MKRTLLTLTAALFATGAVAADAIPPEKVEYSEYGEVDVSLTGGSPGDVENGRILMNKGAGNCIACHQVSALSELPFHGEIGPPLDGIASFRSEAELRGIIANAKKTFPGTMMPAFYKTEGFIRPGEAYTGKAIDLPIEPLLTAQEIEDVVAFLMTLEDE